MYFKCEFVGLKYYGMYAKLYLLCLNYNYLYTDHKYANTFFLFLFKHITYSFHNRKFEDEIVHFLSNLCECMQII